jgi:hypothetical protein
MQSIITTKNLDINEIIITNAKVNKTTKQLTAAILNNKTKSGLYIETPYLINPFGVTSYDGGKQISEDLKTYSLSLKAHGGGQNDNIEDINVMFNFLKELDEKAIDYGVQNSLQIFKKKCSREIIQDALYNRCVKPSVGSDGTVYPDKITIKILKNNQSSLPNVLIFKDSSIPLEIDSWESLQNLIPKGVAIKAIIQPNIYFVNGKMGINFKAIQLKLPNFEKVGRPVTYAFSESIPSKIDNKVETLTNFNAMDSDNEEVEVEVGDE